MISDLIFPTEGFEGIIFDCDGTLVDSMPAHYKAWQIALEEHGAKGVFQEDVFYAMGGRPTTDIVTQLNGDYGLHLDPEEVAQSKRRAFLSRLNEIEIIDEVVEFAREWSGKVPMAIATGGTRLVIEKTLQACGLSDLFEDVITANDVALGKPAPDVFLKAAEAIGVAPEKCLALEDAPVGIMAAQLAGMQVLAVPAPLHVVK